MIKTFKFFLILLILLTSCEKVFNEDDNEYKVLNKKQEKVDVINGIQYLLSKVHNKYYLQLLTRSDELYEYRTHRTGFEEDFEIINIKDAVYKNLYTAIISANSAIAQCNEGSEAHIKGELYFLRAYCYFKLTRLFGTPPLVINTDIDYALNKPSYTEIYEFIESNLLKATDLLPSNISDARIPYETPTIDAAKALLAELYLTWAGYPIKDESKYAKAAKFSSDVIQNNNYSLLEDVAELWKNKNIHHSENIFSLSFKYEEIQYSSMYNGNEYSYTRPNEDCLNNYYDTKVQSRDLAGHNVLEIRGNYLPKLKFYDSYPMNYRKSVFFNIGKYIASDEGFLDPDPVVNFSYYVFDPLHELNPSYQYIVCLKGIDQESLIDLEDQVDHGSSVPLYLLRYANTLLTYAEAKARIGKLDASAYEAINKVRRRANNLSLEIPSKFDLTPNLSQQQFIDSVIWERAWELCFEPDGRWFDIIRLDLKEELHEYILAKDYYVTASRRYLHEFMPESRFKDIPEECLSKNWYFYAIPEKDRWINPNLEDGN